MSESDLVKSAAAGNKTALEQLYMANVHGLYKFVRHKVETNEIAEDIVSEAFTRAFGALNNFEGRSSFKTYVYTIAKNLVIEHYKNRTKQVPVQADRLDRIAANSKLEKSDTNDSVKERQIKDILIQLPKKYSEVLELRYLTNFTVKETAQTLGISDANVKVLTHRALQKCKELIKN